MTPDEYQAVVDLVVACGRMRDNWAEGDAEVKHTLWTAVHTAADRVDELFGVHPL